MFLSRFRRPQKTKRKNEKQGDGPRKGRAGNFWGLAFEAEGKARTEAVILESLAATQQEHQAGRGLARELRQEGVVVIGGTERRLVSAASVFLFPQFS